MPNPFLTAGANPEPSKYAPLHINRMSSGLWTNRSPLRDGPTSLLNEKYSGPRFDPLIGGNNMELTSKLTLGRSPGFSVYNDQVFPAIDFFYDFRRFTATSESIKVMADTAATVYDATGPSTKTAVFTKSAGAGQTYFQDVGNILFFGDGVDQKKWLQPSLVWSAAAAFTLGQFLIDSNNNIQQVTTAGTSGGSLPTWNAAVRGTTTDNTVTWTNRGNYVANWGIGIPPAITIAPPTSPDIFAVRFWTANHTYGAGGSNLYVIWDGTNMHLLQDGTKTTGATYPFANNIPEFGGLTPDGTASWINIGGMIPQSVALPADPRVFLPFNTLIDSNGNIQITIAGGSRSGAPPVWTTTVGSTVADGAVTWECLGAANLLVFFNWQYAAAFHTVDGNYGSATPLVPSFPVMGAGPLSIIISGTGSVEGQVDKIYIFRTADEGSIPLFLASVANPGASSWTFTDTLPDTALDILVQADRASQNKPPPVGLINLTYHLGRIWGSVGNTVFYSSVQSATTPAPVQGFSLLNSDVVPSNITRLVPIAAFGILVFTISDIYVIGGDGTANNPIRRAVPFIPGIGLLSYNALDQAGGTMYLLASDGKVLSLDPSSGASRVGFAIEDQLALYDPSTAYVAWHSFKQDEGLHVSDGSTSWYRMNPTPAPESGNSWSPKRTIQGGVKAVQSIETSPGVHYLLAWQTSTGQIIRRDPSVFSDNGSTYACNGTIGSITLAQPGQLAEVSFLSIDSAAAGTRVTPSVLLNEISGPFESLSKTPLVNEPPLLPASSTLFSNRYYLISDQEPVWCRHMQIDFSWPAEAAANELLTWTIFGAHHQEV
jgi:hypothetical protein